MKDPHQNSSVAAHLGHGHAPLDGRVVRVGPAPAGLVARLGSPMAIASLAVLLAGCHGPLSTLDPAGGDAAEIARLFWWMAGGAAVVWAAMVALTLYCVYAPRRPDAQRYGPLLVVGGGVALPTIALTALLVAGLPSLPRLTDAPRAGHRKIEVIGEQWWWRIRYATAQGMTVELANELRLPVGERVEVS